MAEINLDNVVIAAIFNQIKDPDIWRRFSHVNKITYRVSKILLRKKTVEKLKDNIPFFEDQINKHDISKVIYYELPSGKRYGPIFIYDINNELFHMYSTRSKDYNNNKTMCRTFYPGTFVLEKEKKCYIDETFEYKEYYRNGNIKLKLRKKLNNIRHGLCQKWSEKGTLLSEINYKLGQRHGTCKTFRANGSIRYNYIYDNGQLIFREIWNKRYKKIC